MENNSGKISVALGGIAVVGAVALTACALILSVPLTIVIVGGCVVAGLAAGSAYAGRTYFQQENQTSERNPIVNDINDEEQTALLRPKKEHSTKVNRISKHRLEEKSVSLSKKKRISEETKKEAREALYQSAQLLQLDPNQKSLAFENYLKAAELGEEESLAPLELLAEEMSSKNQLKLSAFYGKFLNNSEKATYCRENGMD